MVLEKDKIKVANIRIDIILFTLVQNIVCCPGWVNSSAKLRDKVERTMDLVDGDNGSWARMPMG